MRVVEALNGIAGNIIEWPRGEKATRVKHFPAHFWAAQCAWSNRWIIH